MTWCGKRLVAGLCLLLFLSISACTEESAPRRATTAGQPVGGPTSTLKLAAAHELPAALRKLKVDGALEMPAGWSVDTVGVHRSGRFLAFGANGPGAGSAQVWVLDTVSGVARRYPVVNRGWYAGIAVVAGTWMLRVERQQLDGGRCPGGQADDCFQWKLYAQAIPAGAPRLVAQSEKPGSQVLVPFPVTDGRRFAWEQGGGSNGGALYLWQPGKGSPSGLGARAVPGGVLTLVGDQLFVEEHRTDASGAIGRSTITRMDIAHAGRSSTVASYTGACCAAVTNDSLAYFPTRSDASAAMQVKRLDLAHSGKSTPLPSPPPVQGYYTSEWINDHTLLTWSLSGVQIYDATGATHPVTVGADTGMAVPRVDQGYVDLAYPEADGGAPSVIAWKRF